ncbi:MAG: DUF1290 domain-containing protein [Ruminococcaceae bacterium]|nr:DUF1290 domain-containing protein [Oscillospiraceae bacterium]
MTIAIICLIIGGLLGFFVNINVTAVASVYIAIAIFACFDSIMGGIVAATNKKFDLLVFLTGLFSNSVLSIAIIFLGTKLGIDLYVPIVIVFSIRIFQNFAIIRIFLLNKWRNFVKIERDAEKKD